MVFTGRGREFCHLAQALRRGGYQGHLIAGGPFASFNCERLLRDYPEATRLPAELFYQTSPGQLEDAVATHHAAGSWKSVESYRRAVKLAEQRNYELRGRIEELERELAGKRRFLRR